MNVALFTIFRNESIYANEFIKHYLDLGFNHIYLIDNSNNDQLDFILNSDFKNNVTIIDLRMDNNINLFGRYQANLYTSLYNIFNVKYDWLAFFDIDEFLILNEDKTIQEYLSRDIFNGIDQIHINWLVYDDNDQLYYSPNPLIKRFTRVSKKYYDIKGPAANGIKSILRSNLNLKFITMHTAVSTDNDKNLITVDNDGLFYDQTFSSHAHATYKYAQLNHYITKSTEEYIKKNISGDYIKKYFEINEYSDIKNKILVNAQFTNLYDMHLHNL